MENIKEEHIYIYIYIYIYNMLYPAGVNENESSAHGNSMFWLELF